MDTPLIERGKAYLAEAIIKNEEIRTYLLFRGYRTSFTHVGATYVHEEDGQIAKAVLILYGDGKHHVEWLHQGETPSEEFFKILGSNKFKLIIAE